MTNCFSKTENKVNCPEIGGNEGEKLKPCCVCPETRKARDECILRYGPDSDACKKVMEAHDACLASYGFKMQ
jgi:cytochrome c oxidase assembly protein subunit 17